MLSVVHGPPWETERERIAWELSPECCALVHPEGAECAICNPLYPIAGTAISKSPAYFLQRLDVAEHLDREWRLEQWHRRPWHQRIFRRRPC